MSFSIVPKGLSVYASGFAGGDGSIGNPYVISEAGQFSLINSNLAVYYNRVRSTYQA